MIESISSFFGTTYAIRVLLVKYTLKGNINALLHSFHKHSFEFLSLKKTFFQHYCEEVLNFG